jgi:hypothetical protein
LQTKLIPALLAPAILLALAAPALAGNGNTLYLVQDSPAGTTDGNNFLSDQTLANYSSIGTNGSPALQSGTGNQADITIKSKCSISSPAATCGYLAFTQDNTGAGLEGVLTVVPEALLSNYAKVTIDGLGTAAILQHGGNNSATLEVVDGHGDITQTGLDNKATLTLASATTGSIEQRGINNRVGMNVIGVGGGGATLTQIGSNLDAETISVTTTGSVAVFTYGSSP